MDENDIAGNVLGIDIGYESLCIDEYLDKITEILYHKKLIKIGLRINWFREWELKSDMLKQDTWEEKNFIEWEKAHLMNIIAGGTVLRKSFIDVVPKQGWFGEQERAITCVICGKTIQPLEKYPVTGLIIKFSDPCNESVDLFCEPRHIECESKKQ